MKLFRVSYFYDDFKTEDIYVVYAKSEDHAITRLMKYLNLPEEAKSAVVTTLIVGSPYSVSTRRV